jgi:hypothetical protein
VTAFLFGGKIEDIALVVLDPAVIWCLLMAPLAQKYSGSSSLIGKAALAPYWRTALENITALEFTLDHAIWDPNASELLVLYEANINGERKRACELMTFNSSGRQIRGEALYGATL